MKTNWFARRGIFFVPAAPIGWLLGTACGIYAVWAFSDIDIRSHSASDTLINWVFQLLLLAAAYSFVAYFTSPKE